MKIAKASRILDNFTEKICVKIKATMIKTPKDSNENNPTADDITKNQRESPSVTAKDLNLGDENSNLNRINQTDEACLC